MVGTDYARRSLFSCLDGTWLLRSRFRTSRSVANACLRSPLRCTSSVRRSTRSEATSPCKPLIPRIARRPGTGDQTSRSRRLEEAIGHASHVLPAQGPITVFIHHNTLHAFEDLPFHEAVKKGPRSSGASPICPRTGIARRWRGGGSGSPTWKTCSSKTWGPGRTRRFPCFGTRLELCLAMLQYPLRSGPTEELVWYVAEANALRRVRSEVSSAVRRRLIAETRRWVIRDLRGGSRQRPVTVLRLSAVVSKPGRAAGPVRRGGDRDLDRRRLGRIHASGSLATLLRRGPRPATVHSTAAAASTAARHVARGDRRRHRRLGPRRVDPVLRGVLDQGMAKLAAAPAQRGVLPRVLLALPPSGLGTRRLDARARARARPPA